MSKKQGIWITWLASSLALVAVLAYELAAQPQKPNFLTGPGTHGHYQIELQCDACHTDPLGGGEVLQDACVNCHGQELNDAMDSNPKSKFTDPRNADLISTLDARYCTTCHLEHNPDITREMGVTLPIDFCVQCHGNIGEERDSHAGMSFDTCASAGCHNYHDNRALYEDFLLRHAMPGDHPTVAARTPGTTLSAYIELLDLKLADRPGDIGTVPAEVLSSTAFGQIQHDWLSSRHGQTGVTCAGCHAPDNLWDAESRTLSSRPDSDWIEQPGIESCGACHGTQADGFVSGKHGMRLAQGLPPMTPAEARQPMRAEASHAELGCNSCHQAHTDDRIQAAASACLVCHADEHSLSFEESPHGKLWDEVSRGMRSPTEGVSCATCHLPAVEEKRAQQELAYTEHNQNATLRPNEKMIRTTCLHCHTLQFSLDALADEALILRNFDGPPEHRVDSIPMVLEREQQRDQR